MGGVEPRVMIKNYRTIAAQTMAQNRWVVKLWRTVSTLCLVCLWSFRWSSSTTLMNMIGQNCAVFVKTGTLWLILFARNKSKGERITTDSQEREAATCGPLVSNSSCASVCHLMPLTHSDSLNQPSQRTVDLCCAKGWALRRCTSLFRGRRGMQLWAARLQFAIGTHPQCQCQHQQLCPSTRLPSCPRTTSKSFTNRGETNEAKIRARRNRRSETPKTCTQWRMVPPAERNEWTLPLHHHLLHHRTAKCHLRQTIHRQSWPAMDSSSSVRSRRSASLWSKVEAESNARNGERPRERPPMLTGATRVGATTTTTPAMKNKAITSQKPQKRTTMTTMKRYIPPPHHHHCHIALSLSLSAHIHTLICSWRPNQMAKSPLPPILSVIVFSITALVSDLLHIPTPKAFDNSFPPLYQSINLSLSLFWESTSSSATAPLEDPPRSLLHATHTHKANG